MGTGPSSLANCIGWFEAHNGPLSSTGPDVACVNGTNVTRWMDLSGDLNHMDQATPANCPFWYSDPNEPFPLVRFPRNDATGIRCIFRTASPTLDRAAMSVFAVCRHDGTQGSISGNSMFLFGGGVGGTHGSIEIGQPGYPSPRCTYRLAQNGSFNSYTTIRVPNSLGFIGLSCGASSVKAYIDNQSSMAGAAYGAGTSTGWALGAATGALGSPWYGDVAALFVFNAALSDANVETLRAYCRNRWTLPTIAYNVVCEGDSITSGVPATLNNRVLSWQVDLPRSFRTHCVGRAGEQIAQSVTDFAVGTQGCFDATLGPGRNILVYWMGTNDISGSSGATVYAAYASYCATARANGWKVVAVTMLPRNTGGNETNRTDFNTLLRANWSNFADALADVDLCSLMNTVASTASSYYEADRIHPSELGNRVLGTILQQAVFEAAQVASPTPRVPRASVIQA